MDERPRVPAFSIDRMLLCGLIPIARCYACIHCGHDLTDWIMKQSPSDALMCPNCEVAIDEREIAQAQRDTRLGCLWTLVGIVCLLLAAAAVVGLVWLMTGPRPLLRIW